jgi:hypothetical protein
MTEGQVYMLLILAGYFLPAIVASIRHHRPRLEQTLGGNGIP